MKLPAQVSGPHIPPAGIVQKETMTNTTLLTILSRQEVIEPGQKATVCQDTLWRDTVYDTTGDTGRWAMNTFFRGTTTGRREVCAHIEWLVAQIESVNETTCVEHELFERNIGRLLLTIGSLMGTYPQEHGVDESQSPYMMLEDCMVRLLHLNTTMPDMVRRAPDDNEEFHV
jgi:hypothetical protein